MAIASPPIPAACPTNFAGIPAALLWAFGFVAGEVIEGDTTAFDQTVTSFFRDAGSLSDP